jgi:hypothetical protein
MRMNVAKSSNPVPGSPCASCHAASSAAKPGEVGAHIEPISCAISGAYVAQPVSIRPKGAHVSVDRELALPAAAAKDPALPAAAAKDPALPAAAAKDPALQSNVALLLSPAHDKMRRHIATRAESVMKYPGRGPA